MQQTLPAQLFRLISFTVIQFHNIFIEAHTEKHLKMALKLYTDLGNFRSFKILIAAEYNSVAIDLPEYNPTEVASKSPAGRVPILETPSGTIFESNAIARYIARIRRDTELYGVSFFESAQVDSWIDFTSHDIELVIFLKMSDGLLHFLKFLFVLIQPATLWFYPVIGYLPYNPAATSKAKADFARALGVLERHLADKTYLVGHKITLADITVASALVYPFKFVADAAFRSPFPNVIRWFNTLVHQPAFEAVIGTVQFAEQEITPGGAAPVAAAAAAPASTPAKKEAPKDKAPKEKKEKAPKVEKPKEEAKPKEEKKKAKKEEDEDEPEPDFVPEKKAEHPFKILDKNSPSTFVMDTWKKTYSNCDDYHVAMDTFWSTFDSAGWSIFRGDYQYNDELKVLFMTSNLIGGFIQRTEEIRKWLFGTMTIRGVEGEGMKVTCYYLIRGDSIQPLIACNDDASCYTWTKLDTPPSEADKTLLYDYWCSEGPLDGEPCLDSRCYK